MRATFGSPDCSGMTDGSRLLGSNNKETACWRFLCFCGEYCRRIVSTRFAYLGFWALRLAPTGINVALGPAFAGLTDF